MGYPFRVLLLSTILVLVARSSAQTVQYNYPVIEGDVQSAQVLVNLGSRWIDAGTPFDGLITSEGPDQLSELPDAPSTTQCEWSPGHACASWLHYLVGQYPPTKESEARVALHQIGWTTPFKQKRFVLPYLYWAAGTLFDIEVTHEGLQQHKCSESNPELGPHPSLTDEYIYSIKFDGGMMVGVYLLAKLGMPWFGYDVAPAIQGTRHFRAGSEWFRFGCM